MRPTITTVLTRRPTLSTVYTRPRDWTAGTPVSFDSDIITFDALVPTWDAVSEWWTSSITTAWDDPRYAYFLEDLLWSKVTDLAWEQVLWISWTRTNKISTIIT